MCACREGNREGRAFPSFPFQSRCCLGKVNYVFPFMASYDQRERKTCRVTQEIVQPSSQWCVNIAVESTGCSHCLVP